ncbi:MAG: DUF3789 domain-containing protein [Bacilli bacterium]|nr:DUF3789 domain-containing protein [Bacilli bacterium]
MIGKILGVLLIGFILLFTICSCIVAKWADKDWEDKKK